MRQTLATQLKSEQAARMLDAVQPRVNALMLEQMSWARLKPGFARIYAEAFSQEEVDGLIAFYQGPIGSALISKTPQLMQRSIQMMQERMAPMLQQVAQITKEEIEKERVAAACATEKRIHFAAARRSARPGAAQAIRCGACNLAEPRSARHDPSLAIGPGHALSIARSSCSSSSR